MIPTASVDVALPLRVSWDKRELVGTIQFNFLLIWQLLNAKAEIPLLSSLERLPSGVVLSLAV